MRRVGRALHRFLRGCVFKSPFCIFFFFSFSCFHISTTVHRTCVVRRITMYSLHKPPFACRHLFVPRGNSFSRSEAVMNFKEKIRSMNKYCYCFRHRVWYFSFVCLHTHRRGGLRGRGTVTSFLPEKSTQCSNGRVLKLGYKRNQIAVNTLKKNVLIFHIVTLL